MNKAIYGIIEVESGKYVAKYQTRQGNTKTAFFTEERHALKAINVYLKSQYPNHKFVLARVGQAFADGTTRQGK